MIHFSVHSYGDKLVGEWIGDVLHLRIETTYTEHITRLQYSRELALDLANRIIDSSPGYTPKIPDPLPLSDDEVW